MTTYSFDRLADIKRIAGERMDEVISGTLLDLSAKVIRMTPVGNPDLWITKDENGNYVDYIAEKGYPEGYVGGTARGNWQATIGQPAMGELARVDDDGAATIADVAPVTEAAPGNVYYLTNNVPYIIPLEDGRSTQSPAGMVRINLAQLDRDIDAQIAQLPR